MKTLTIKICTLDDTIDRLKKAVKTRRYAGSTLSFGTYDDFARTITGNRLRMMNTLLNEGEGLTVRALAAKLGRNVRGVHDDIKELESLGVLINERGNIHVPYDDVHIDVHIKSTTEETRAA